MITNPPLRLKIIKAITATLKTITPANGYQNDLSDTEFEKRVVRGRLFLGDDEGSTLVSVIEPPTSVEQIAQKAPDNSKRATEWDIMIQGWSKDSSDPADEPCDKAYVLGAEIVQALAVEKKKVVGPHATYMLGFKQIMDMQIGSPVVRPSEEVTAYGQLYIILTLKLAEDMAQPFG